jgi:hypothetical protein
VRVKLVRAAYEEGTMQLERIGLVGVIAGVVLGGIFAAAGCEGVDDPVSGPDEAELHGGSRFHHVHRVPDAGIVGGGGSGGSVGTTGGGTGVVTGGTADGGAVADCDVCTQAQQCCDVVASGGPVCSFSAASCSSMVGDARPAYVNACLVFLVTARGARANPPAECR